MPTSYPPLTFARFARTSAIRVCQPAPLAFHAAMTLVATRIDSSLLGSASFGRPRRMSVSPLRRSASAIQRAVSSGASSVLEEIRPGIDGWYAEGGKKSE